MNIAKVIPVIFSPTDSTKKIALDICTEINQKIEVLDITPFAERTHVKSFASDELAIFAVPVYGGRVPQAAVQSIKNMKGDQTPAVLIAVYGNREYDDALLELKNLVVENGFVVVAAAAFLAEHSIMHSVAHGRPDAADMQKINDFADRMWEKLQNASSITDFEDLNIKGNMPYKEYGGVPLKPHATSDCTKCGLCAVNCPVNAIPSAAPNKTDSAICISCMRCMKICPIHARKLNQLMLTVAEKAFAQKNSERKEAEIFI